MSISGTAKWDVRTTGNDANGGFYTSGGTDYSQQDVAQWSANDATCDGATNIITSVTGGFTAAMVGNGINFGTLFLEVTGFTNGNTITVDRVPAGPAINPSKIGGALLSPAIASANITAGNKIYIKSGAYTISSATSNIVGGCIAPSAVCDIIGYGAAHDDGGTQPVLTLTAINASGVSLSINRQYCTNVTVDCNNKAASTGFQSGACAAVFDNCLGKNSVFGGFYNSGSSIFRFCTATGCSVQAAFRECFCFACLAIANTSTGFQFTNTGAFAQFCMSINNTGASSDGFDLKLTYGSIMTTGCTAYGNGRDGFRVAGNISGYPCNLFNCLAVNSGGFGFGLAGTADLNSYLKNCAGYNNTSGNVDTANGFTGKYNQGFVTLAGSPFVNAAGLNFALVAGSTANAAGVPNIWNALISTTSAPDIGAVQGTSVQSGGAPVLTVVQSGGSAVLTWTATAGAVHYLVLRTNTDPSLSTPMWVELAIVAGATLTYTDAAPTAPSYYTVVPLAF